MRRATIRKALMIAGLLTLAVSAYAASINLSSPATLNGKQLAAGEYSVKVSGDTVTLRHGNIEATAKARVEERQTKAQSDSVVTKDNGNGLPSITEIQFEGKKQVLVFDNSAQASNQR